MDWTLEDTSVAILGAGFSVACTNGRMPLMGTFFDRLCASQAPVLHDFVNAVAGDPKTANVESVLLTLDQIRTSPDAVLEGWADRWKKETVLIQRQLATYALNRLADCDELESDHWAIQTLARFTSKTTVISMNYDNITDMILSNREGIRHRGADLNCPHCKMRLLLQKACSCDGRGAMVDSDWQGALIKPHGSIAWRRCLNPECCSYECLVADARCRPFEDCACPTCRHPCGPVLVMPTMSKNLSDTPEIGVMWQAARKAIAGAESLLLFGFSMPSSDELLTQLIRAAIASNRKLKRIASIDISPDAVLARLKKCLPSDLAVEEMSLAVVPNVTPSWYR